ncbi:TPM domain-containing protein [Naasia aerilata]|uniref:TPM domain-containing protein n=1 Tax=Naasia aerilata TaxID=1162966 RepID=UPI00257233E1|nr:TPM domain-containing protein [Naasia aerilata]
MAPNMVRRAPGWARILLTGMATALLVGTAAPAFAVAPVDFGGSDVVDQAGVLSASDESRVQSSLDDLQQSSGVTLLVAYIDSPTDPSDIGAWTDQVATANGLGSNNALLVVAVEDRQYRFSVAESSSPPISRMRSSVRTSSRRSARTTGRAERPAPRRASPTPSRARPAAEAAEPAAARSASCRPWSSSARCSCSSRSSWSSSGCAPHAARQLCDGRRSSIRSSSISRPAPCWCSSTMR